MAYYRQGSISFEPPQRWVDTTIVGFAPTRPAGGPPAPSIKMWREAFRPNDTLLAHSNRMMVKVSGELPAFDLLESAEVLVGGRRAALMRFRFKSQGDVIDQTRVAVDPADDPDGSVVVFMAAAKVDEADDVRASFFEVLRTVRFDAVPDVAETQFHGAPEPPAARPSQVPAAPSPQPAPPPLVPMPGQRPGRY